MVISFVGIIVFVAFAVVNNQNISYEAYNYISLSSKSLDFSTFESNVNNNMRTSYADGNPENGKIDEYAKYINKAISELNKANEHFLNYLAVEKDLTKGEQDKLRELYGNYLSKFDDSKKAYNDYILAYSDADYQFNEHHDSSSVAVSIVISNIFLIRLIIFFVCHI